MPRPLYRTFDYAAPASAPAIGTRVRVPFGRAKVVGVVAGLREASPHALKTIEQVLDAKPLLTPDLVELAAWLAAYYHHPIGEVYATLLPAKARQGGEAVAKQQTAWVATASDLPAQLERAPKQRRTFARLLQLGQVLDAEVSALGMERRSLLALQKKGLAARSAVNTLAPHSSANSVRPTPAQQAAITAIRSSLDTPATHLLDGVTGSGKTEVYMRVIAAALETGGQALVLVPEIALTPQTVARFKERFGAAATLHSGVSDAQRFNTWLHCANGTHKVVIGTRSAVLAPFANLRIIVVDEEHDGSFKQHDGLRYSARDVAVKRGQMLSIPVVLGSATPSLESLANVRRRRYRYSRLAQRAGGASMPVYRVLDIRGERLDRNFSSALHDAVARHLAAGGQVLVFINRRGFAPVLLCSQCAWRSQCPHCDARLVFHRTPRQLRCHHCGFRQAAPSRCPDCGGEELTPIGTGTQRAEEALAERHPDVPLYRIDRDTVRSVRQMEADLAAVNAGETAILVGTQMLAKGHHFPNVTLVAVLNADIGFLAADFRAPERTAQLIVQVAGRAGRAERPGEVWIQTFDPQNPNLVALMRSGYHGFAANELNLRSAANMPPYASLAIVRAESRRETAASQLLAEAAGLLAAPGIELLGPAPAPIARRADHYHAQIMVLSSRRADLHRALVRLEQAELKAAGVRWAIDVDPMDTY